MKRKIGISLFILLAVAGISFFFYGFINTISLSTLESLQTTCISYDKVDLLKYRANGQQTKLSADNIKIVESKVKRDKNVIKMIKNIYKWEKANFKSKHAGGTYVGRRSVNDIFSDKTLTGCHDYGIVFSAVLRHFGIASVMVDASAINWAFKYHDGKTKSFSGHVFVEVYYDEKCVLVDPNFGRMIINYNPENPIIPTTFWFLDSKGFYVLYKGLDPLDYGVGSIEVLNEKLKDFSNKINEMDIIIPKYKMININYLNIDK